MPAAELERAVAIAVKRMLEDKWLLATALEPSDLDASQLASLLRIAEGCAKQLQSGAETETLLASLIERVELKPEGLGVSIKLPISTAASASPAVSITHELPIQIQTARSGEALVHPRRGDA